MSDKEYFTESKIGAYLEGRLSDAGRSEFERLMTENKGCLEEFISINRSRAVKDELITGDAPEYLIERAIDLLPEKKGLVDIVLKVVNDSIQILRTLADLKVYTPLPAYGIRNVRVLEPKIAVVTKSFDRVEAELDIEKVGGKLCNIKVSIADISTETLMNDVRVELISGGRVLASEITENGGAIFEDIGFGSYTVKLRKNGEFFGRLRLRIE